MEHIIAKLIQDFEQGKVTRRQLIQSLALAATAASAAIAAPAPASDSNVMKVTYLNHLGYSVADYNKTRDFYADLFGMKEVSPSDPTQGGFTSEHKNVLRIGDTKTTLNFHPRHSPGPVIDHISLTIANWDKDKSVRPAVEAEIKRRGIPLLQEHNTGYAKSKWPLSLHINDPDGLGIQIGGADQ